MIKINPQLERKLTSPVTYLKGEFALHIYKIPYYSAVLPMDFIAENFSLIDEIPNSERIEWTIEELFQRDISWDRVDEELVKYLCNESTQQFFNSLTIALLPKEGHGLAENYNPNSSIIPNMEGELEAPIQVGGFQIQSFKDSGGWLGN